MTVDKNGIGANEPGGEYTTVSFDVTLPSSSERYVPKRFHARGGMGEVWLAVDNVIGREVALKHIREKLADHHARFIAEAQIAGQLEHPSIVPVHDIGTGKNGQPYYVMKFVRGHSLKDVIQEFHAGKRMDASAYNLQLRRLLEVFVKLCEAVAYAHNRGVIHRDLKPDNVMLGSFGETVVLDWGLAKLLHGPEIPGSPNYAGLTSSVRSDETHDGSVIGSPPYMPPEMAEGRAGETGPRTDVYLLGATLYTILCGEPPRRGSSHEEMVELAKTVPPVPPRSRDRRVHRALEAICLKAMSMRAQDRYASALEVSDEVRRYLAGEPVSAYPEGVVVRAARQAKRHWRAISAAAAAVAILGLASHSVTTAKRAALLTQREETQAKLVDFRQLAEDAFFALASTNAPEETVLYYDRENGLDAARTALRLCKDWGTGLENFSLETQRADVKGELFELILVYVQARLAGELDSDGSEELVALLEQANVLGGHTPGWVRLASDLRSRVGENAHAKLAELRASESVTPPTAFDYFLEGESHRMASSRVSDPSVGARQSQDSQNKLAEAVAAYESAVRLSPKHFWSNFQLGRCYLAMGKKDESLACARACVALKPENPWGVSSYGLVLAMLGKQDSAVEYLDRVIQRDPTFQPARLHRGFTRMRQKQNTLALEDFDFILKAPESSRLIEAAYYRAQVYLQLGDLKQAIDDATMLIRRRPNFGPAYLLRAEARFRGGNDSAAIKAALDDVDELVESALGRTAPRDSAEWSWKKGLILDHIANAMSYRSKTGQSVLRLALPELKRAAKEQPSAEVFATLGAISYKLRILDDAVDNFTTGLSLEPKNTKLLSLRGAAYDDLGKHEQAAADFEYLVQQPVSLVRERERVAEAHARLGILRATQKDRAAAESQVVAAFIALQGGSLRPQPAHYTLNHNLACVYGELCKWDEEHRPKFQKKALQLIDAALRGADDVGIKSEWIQVIQKERCFESLKKLPEFDRLTRS